MAIQGIINGFASKADPARNLALVGRGASYLLCQNGLPCEDGVFSALDTALPAFSKRAALACEADWVAIRAIVSNNVNNRYEVTEIGSATYASYAASENVPSTNDEGVIRLMGTIEAVDDPAAEYLPGATAKEIGFVHMQSIVGEYDALVSVDEWAWVTRTACFADGKNSLEGPNPTYELIVRLSDIEPKRNVSPALAKVLAEASKKNLVYLIFSHRKSRLNN